MSIILFVGAGKAKSKPEMQRKRRKRRIFWGHVVKPAVISRHKECVIDVTTPKNLCFLRFLCIFRF